MTKHLMIFTASLAIAACSASASPNTAVTLQSGPDLASALQATPSQSSVPEVIPPPLVVPGSAPRAPAPEALAPQAVAPPVAAPNNVVPAVAPAINARFSCDIEVKRTSHGIRITPVVQTDRAMAGEYSLVITKSGASGSSDINQGGPFDAARNEEIALSASEFSLERGDRFRAVLKVRSGGREICRDIRS